MQRGRLRVRGFTLIELLVVIAIIAILASLLMPGLARAKAIAQAVKCKSNLRQMGIALGTYVSENEGKYPFGGMWEPAVAKNLSGVKEGVPAHGMLCPTWKADLEGHAKMTIGPGHQGAPYGYNDRGYDPNPDRDIPAALGGSIGGPYSLTEAGVVQNPERLPTREAQIVNPAEMLALGDGYARYKSLGSTPDMVVSSLWIFRGAGFGQISWALSGHYPDRRHGGRLNMSFCDGHVEDGVVHKWYFSEADSDLRLWRADNELVRGVAR